eukprot:scaffold21550_cov63-Phaeocystis_antarctica.AAC.1
MLSPSLLDGLWATETQGQRAAVRRAVLPLAVPRGHQRMHCWLQAFLMPVQRWQTPRGTPPALTRTG